MKLHWTPICEPYLYGYQAHTELGKFEAVRCYEGEWSVFHTAPGAKTVTWRQSLPASLREMYGATYPSGTAAKAAARKLAEALAGMTEAERDGAGDPGWPAY